MNMFNLLPGWVWAALLAGVSLTTCVIEDRLQAEQLAHQTSKVEYAQRVVNAEKLLASEETKRRKAEQDLNDAQITHQLEVEASNTLLDTVRGNAALASGRLRDATSSLAKQAREQRTNSAFTEVGTATGDPIGVLADVLGRADERAGLLADLADRRYIAGRACERQYDQAYDALKAVNASFLVPRQLPE